MKQIGGIWLPDHETHLVDWMQQKNQVVDGKLTYQWDKQQLALKYCRQFRRALDVGGHCGLWSMHLTQRFDHVAAFEPVPEHRDCFRKNTTPAANITLHGCALGEQTGYCHIHTSRGSSGDSWVNGQIEKSSDSESAIMRRLDDFEYDEVDFIKLDCEGFELFALRGGEATLKRCRPTVCVEQKPGRAQKFGLAETGAVQYLQSLGATLRAHKSGDYILAWD